MKILWLGVVTSGIAILQLAKSSGQSHVEVPSAEPPEPHLAPLPPVVPVSRSKTALVLEGGGALGLANVGVLK